MSYIDFDKYWLGLNEQATTPAPAATPAATAIVGTPKAGDPYEYKKEGETYYTKKKGATNWIKVVKGSEAEKGIIAGVTFGESPNAAATTGAAATLAAGSTAPTAAGVASALGGVAKGTDGITKVQRPDWLKAMLSEYPYVKVETDHVEYYDDKGVMRYSEDLQGKVQMNYAQDDTVAAEWDPAKKPADIQANPLHKGATPAAEAAPAATAPATTPAAAPAPTSKEKLDALNKQQDALKDEKKDLKKDARIDKRLERRNEKDARLEAKKSGANESVVYSFDQYFRKSRR